MYVPCRVSNVRRMSPRRASVRLKAFGTIHQRVNSSAAFVSCVAAYGSVRRRGSEERLRRRGARCDVSSPDHHHTFDTLPSCNVHRHHPRLSLVGELRAACLDCKLPVYIRRLVERRMCGGARSTKFTRGHQGRCSRGWIAFKQLYMFVSEYRTCVSSHRVERHTSVSSAEQKKQKKTKAESLVVVVSSSLPRSPNLPPPAPRVAP
jgi:hypothetical protein